MKATKFILACFAIILALVAIATWIHPYVSGAIICGSAIGTVMAACWRMEKEGR